jgi:AAA15 family ATPase/GTPase
MKERFRAPLFIKSMYLEKLEIQGFKSFANKNLLVFPGLVEGGRRGLTAVVGPNGSGKSNIADAVRNLSEISDLPRFFGQATVVPLVGAY